MRTWLRVAVGYVALEAVFLAAFLFAMGLGMEFDPNNEYCASRTHLLPVDCHYEQSSDQPGDEVCS